MPLVKRICKEIVTGCRVDYSQYEKDGILTVSDENGMQMMDERMNEWKLSRSEELMTFYRKTSLNFIETVGPKANMLVGCHAILRQ